MNILKQNKLFQYLFLTFLITFGCWSVVLILQESNLTSHNNLLRIVSQLFLRVALLGPAIVALIVTNINSWQKFKDYVFKDTFHNYWFLILIAILFFITIITTLDEFKLEVSPIWILPIFLGTLFLAGGQEELGWRGFLQVYLENKFPYPIATIFTGIIWAVWHMPFWFFAGSTHSKIPFFGFLLFTIILSFILSAIYKTSKCIFHCCLLHAFFNTLTLIFYFQINLIFIAGFLIMLLLSIGQWYRISYLESK